MRNRQITNHNAISFILCIVTVLFFRPAGFGQANDSLQIHFIDVGQGDGALLISPQGETVLFDDGTTDDCSKPLTHLSKLGLIKIGCICRSPKADFAVQSPIVAVSSVSPLANNNPPGCNENVVAYITRTGTRYHRAGCWYLAPSMILMPLKEAAPAYRPCACTGRRC